MLQRGRVEVDRCVFCALKHYEVFQNGALNENKVTETSRRTGGKTPLTTIGAICGRVVRLDWLFFGEVGSQQRDRVLLLVGQGKIMEISLPP